MKKCGSCKIEKREDAFRSVTGKEYRYCRACLLRNAKKYRDANPDKRRAAKENWRKANLSRHASNYGKWIESNRAHKSEYMRDYSRSNAARLNAAKTKRQAHRRSAVPKWVNEFFVEECYDLARRRTKSLGFQWSVDHIVPMTSDKVCGLHWEGNLRVIPHLLNISKKNRHWPDMP